MSKRRDFLKQSLLGTAGITLSGTGKVLEPAVLSAGSAEGTNLDAAPFAILFQEEDGKAWTLRWGEPRKIRRFEVEFAKPLTQAELGKLKVQYWHNNWDGRGDPILAERGAGTAGWTALDDWTHGSWKDADTNNSSVKNKIVFTFRNTSGKEFPDTGNDGVGYRKTLKIRLLSDKPLLKPQTISAFTDAVCSRLNVRIALDKPGNASFNPGSGDEGSVEIFNGSVLSLNSSTGSGIVVKDNKTWILPQGFKGELQIETMIAVDPVDQRYDRTILTLRSKKRPVSFLLSEIASGDRILVDDLGILATKGDDPVSLEGYRELRKEFPGRTIFDRVGEHEEQTLMNSWDDMPIKHPIAFVHGLPGNRNVMKQLPCGDVEISNSSRWFRLNRSEKDSSRKGWKAEMPKLLFGLPGDDKAGGRELFEGYIPRLRSWWQDGPIYYEQVTVMTALDQDLSEIRLDDPTLLLMQVRIMNISPAEKADAALKLSGWDQQPEKLFLDGDKVMADKDGKKMFRFLIKADRMDLFQQNGDRINWNVSLGSGESVTLVFLIPSVTLDKDEETGSLRKTDFDPVCRRMCRFWTELTAKGSVMRTPEPWLNDFYKAHVRHLVVNDLKDMGTERLYSHVGTFSYGVYANESVMMIADLDRRGYHEDAEKCLQPWLDFQGTVSLPGNFSDKDGLFYGADGSEDGGYNKHHGYVMWGMAEHWWFTRDRAWMEKSAGKLIKACDWVSRQRKLTMKVNPDGTRPIEYGFLPTGGLEDVQDFWHWLATNTATVWGITSLANAIADYGHPEAERLVKEAKAYKEDVLNGLNEARILSPVVRLRDGSYVPKYPSRLYERGRSFGWIRETLEGSIFMIVQDIIPADSQEATWIMKDFEDNLYISEQYGYTIPVFDRFWFSRGGFSMQSQLLDGPIPYIKSDRIKHYLRAYFNGFTAAFFPHVRMCNEHALPELGYPAGDYFKTSDEAQSNLWLRLMFIREDGNDLYLGQAIPRYWLKDGETIGMFNAPTHFGRISVKMKSEVALGKITAEIYPPERNAPSKLYLRFRHPDSKLIKRVTLNGQAYDKFDAEKEWVLLSGTMRGKQEVVAEY